MRAPRFWDSDGWMPRLLSPLSSVYGVLARIRPILARTEHGAAKVICVGNVVAGGAGKTPVAIALARTLMARGARVHMVSRGYGGRLRGPHRVVLAQDDARSVGDEALLLADVAPAWIARDRRHALRAAAGADVIVCDDGLQNPTFAKDLSILVVDGTQGFGNGRLLPAGPLREPPGDAIARSDAIVIVGENRRGIVAHDRPILGARFVPTVDLLAFAGRPVVAFAGIGRTEKFFAMLAEAGLPLASRHAFADHRMLEEAAFMALVEETAAKGARLVTTEKDWVRLPREARALAIPIPITVAWDDPAALAALLDRVAP
ncbi:MAG: tetraacyldisaccharide 4'-kinase [Alphaproteobacteria bacterium]|nr:tetraacyldisaccharide 4'-kinase [Alphaproteobacteria bacterium]